MLVQGVWGKDKLVGRQQGDLQRERERERGREGRFSDFVAMM